MWYRERSESGVLFVGDLLVFFLALWVTLFVRYFGVPDKELFNAHFIPFFFLSGAWVLVFFIAGLYDKHTEFVKRHLPSTIINAQIINVALAAAFFFFIPYFGITPKTNLLIYLAVSSGLLIAWRLFLFEYILPKRRSRGLLVGEGAEIDELVREVNKNTRYGLEFVRVLDRDMITETKDVEIRLRHLIEKEGVSVVVADARHKQNMSLVPLFFSFMFSDTRVRFIDLQTMYENIFDRIPVSLLQYDWFLAHASRSAHPLYDFLKRGIDICGAAVLSIFLLCVYPFIWLAIRIEDGGPAFISQKRLGIFGTVMQVYKFRTMSTNENGVWLGESKNVVTRVGAFLRKTSIDELPQVLNILRGEMSLVGPRNDMEGLAVRLAEEIPFYTTRTSIKPGITGWAQTHQQYTLGNMSPQSVEETKMRLAYDLYYIKHRSFLLDINIALRTIKTLLSRFGITIRLR